MHSVLLAGGVNQCNGSTWPDSLEHLSSVSLALIHLVSRYLFCWLRPFYYRLCTLRHLNSTTPPITSSFPDPRGLAYRENTRSYRDTCRCSGRPPEPTGWIQRRLHSWPCRCKSRYPSTGPGLLPSLGRSCLEPVWKITFIRRWGHFQKKTIPPENLQDANIMATLSYMHSSQPGNVNMCVLHDSLSRHRMRCK